MAIFISKNKKKYNLSRIPHGDLTVGPYIIRPYTYELRKILAEELVALLNSEPKCVDGLNGNVLDNIIDCWKERAKNGIEKQRAYHLERIRELSSNATVSLSNANDWLVIDERELDKLVKQLDELERQAEAYNKEMVNW